MLKKIVPDPPRTSRSVTASADFGTCNQAHDQYCRFRLESIARMHLCAPLPR